MKIKNILLIILASFAFILVLKPVAAVCCGNECYEGGICYVGSWYEGCEDSAGQVYGPNQVLGDCLTCACTGSGPSNICDWAPSHSDCQTLFGNPGKVCGYSGAPPTSSSCSDADDSTINCDLIENDCSRTTTWGKAGEIVTIQSGVWEYFDTATDGCCGDDSSEEYIMTTIGINTYSACCDDFTDCVDEGSECRDSVLEDTIVNGCSDGIDNDCNGLTDCEELACAGQIGPEGSTCCQDAVSDCTQNTCVDEICGGNNECSYVPREPDDNRECSACNECDGIGLDCQPQADGVIGYDCDNECTYCDAGSCKNRLITDLDINIECSACNECDGIGLDCQPQTGDIGYLCEEDCYDCDFGTCTPITRNDDGSCSDDCTECISGTCLSRLACDSTECSADNYCDIAGGNCQTPDASIDVCLNCVADQTPATWVWDNPLTPAVDESDHQDAGIDYSSSLFDSVTSACQDTSCSDTTPGACSCFNVIGTPVNHKPAAGSSACCGDDSNEYYKPDYYGPECTGDVNDCVWSTGEAQVSNTGNKEYWCYLHEWNICKETDPNTVPIGTKAGDIVGGNFVTCAGVSPTQQWTISADVLPEDQYSCSDGFDNDGDGLTDCEDPDCSGSISGTVTDTETDAIRDARIDVIRGTSVVHTTSTKPSGDYPRPEETSEFENILCGTYDIAASKTDYVSSTANVELPPEGSIIVDFTLVLGTTCEDDCTYVGDNTIHRECDGIADCVFCGKGCGFCDREKVGDSCDLAQPGWIREYYDNTPARCDNGCEIECAEECPKEKLRTEAKVTCDEENLIKVTKLVNYKGKLVKLVIVTCG